MMSAHKGVLVFAVVLLTLHNPTPLRSCHGDAHTSGTAGKRRTSQDGEALHATGRHLVFTFTPDACSSAASYQDVRLDPSLSGSLTASSGFAGGTRTRQSDWSLRKRGKDWREGKAAVGKERKSEIVLVCV